MRDDSGVVARKSGSNRHNSRALGGSKRVEELVSIVKKYRGPKHDESPGVFVIHFPAHDLGGNMTLQRTSVSDYDI